MVQIIDNNDGTREYRNDTPGIGKIKENSSKVKTMNKETKFKFVIQHGDQTIELTIEEAEKLYNDLDKIFNRERVKGLPPKFPSIVYIEEGGIF